VNTLALWLTLGGQRERSNRGFVRPVRTPPRGRPRSRQPDTGSDLRGDMHRRRSVANGLLHRRSGRMAGRFRVKRTLAADRPPFEVEVTDPGAPYPATPIVLVCWRCPCTGLDTITFDPDRPGHVSAYHHPRECEHGTSYVIVLQRSNYKPRPWQPPTTARRARKEKA
jgi:hypothetical protein